MKRALFCGLGIVLGHLAGALIGGGILQFYYDNMSALDLAAAAEFITGPIGALIGAIIGWVATGEGTSGAARRKR